MTAPIGSDFKVTSTVSTWLCVQECPFLETREHHANCQHIPDGSNKKYSIEITEPTAVITSRKDFWVLYLFLFIVFILGFGSGVMLVTLLR